LNLEELLEQAEAKFENAKAEMYRCQGEYRALQKLMAEQEEKEAPDPQQDAATITAKPDKEKK